MVPVILCVSVGTAEEILINHCWVEGKENITGGSL